jgi:hypothetical protein
MNVVATLGKEVCPFLSVDVRSVSQVTDSHRDTLSHFHSSRVI